MSNDSSRLVRVGQPLRYGRISDFPSTQETVAGLVNWWWLTKSMRQPSLPALRLDRGISAPARAGLERQPVILLRSSPHKAGSEITPWEDVIRPDEGYARFFGDNRVGSGRRAHESEGNARMLAAFDLHASSSADRRAAAPPVLLLEGFGLDGRRKGQIKFQGLCVIQRAELLVQRDPMTGQSFTNYRFDLVILDLKADDDTLRFDWIDARRDPALTNDEAARSAPLAWRTWAREGAPALERLQRRVVKRRVTATFDQRPAPQSRQEQLLKAVYSHYKQVGEHRFEVLADFVVAEVLREAGVTYRPGWVTRGTGDSGVDFVGTVDLDPDGGFPSSRVVLLGQAKCEDLNKPTNALHIARLAARLRRGWFGAYVTTSYFSLPVQQEVLVDKYPVLLIHGRRLAEILHRHLMATATSLDSLLDELDATYVDRIGIGDPEQALL